MPDEYVSFLTMSDVGIDGTTGSGKLRSFREVSKGYTLFERGDVLVAKITPCFENGKIAQAAPVSDVAAGSTEFHVIRPISGAADPRYILRFLRHPRVRAAGGLRMTGSGGQRRVPESYLRLLEVPLPPIERQRRIADILDHADDLRRMHRTSLTLLESLGESTFLDMFGDPVSNTLGWPVVKVGDVIDSATYGTARKASTVGPLAVLRMGNITSAGFVDITDLKFMELPEAEIEKHTVRRGDILFNRTNSPDLVGKSAVYRNKEPMAYAGYLVRLRCKADTDSEYLGAFLNLRSTKRVLRSICKSIIGMANINARELQELRVPRPPIELQAEFSKRTRVALKHRACLHQQGAALDALFASLQYRAFAGLL